MDQSVFDTILIGLVVVAGVITFGLAVVATGLELVPGPVGALAAVVSACVVYRASGLLKIDDVVGGVKGGRGAGSAAPFLQNQAKKPNNVHDSDLDQVSICY